MNKREILPVERNLAKKFALHVLGDEIVRNAFDGQTADVEIVGMKTRPPFVQLANGRPSFDRLLQPARILTTEDAETDAPLLERLHLSSVPRQRRQDLGGIISERLQTVGSEKGEGQIEWMGAGLALFAEAHETLSEKRNSDEYKLLNGKSILFPGVIVSGRQFWYVPMLTLTPKGPGRGLAAFQQDYDANDGEWLVARGTTCSPTRTLEG